VDSTLDVSRRCASKRKDVGGEERMTQFPPSDLSGGVEGKGFSFRGKDEERRDSASKPSRRYRQSKEGSYRRERKIKREKGNLRRKRPKRKRKEETSPQLHRSGTKRD